MAEPQDGPVPPEQLLASMTAVLGDTNLLRLILDDKDQDTRMALFNTCQPLRTCMVHHWRSAQVTITMRDSAQNLLSDDALASRARAVAAACRGLGEVPVTIRLCTTLKEDKEQDRRWRYTNDPTPQLKLIAQHLQPPPSNVHQLIINVGSRIKQEDLLALGQSLPHLRILSVTAMQYNSDSLPPPQLAFVHLRELTLRFKFGWQHPWDSVVGAYLPQLTQLQLHGEAPQHAPSATLTPSQTLHTLILPDQPLCAHLMSFCNTYLPVLRCVTVLQLPDQPLSQPCSWETLTVSDLELSQLAHAPPGPQLVWQVDEPPWGLKSCPDLNTVEEFGEKKAEEYTERCELMFDAGDDEEAQAVAAAATRLAIIGAAAHTVTAVVERATPDYAWDRPGKKQKPLKVLRRNLRLLRDFPPLTRVHLVGWDCNAAVVRELANLPPARHLYLDLRCFDGLDMKECSRFFSGLPDSYRFVKLSLDFVLEFDEDELEAMCRSAPRTRTADSPLLLQFGDRLEHEVHFGDEYDRSCLLDRVATEMQRSGQYPFVSITHPREIACASSQVRLLRRFCPDAAELTKLRREILKTKFWSPEMLAGEGYGEEGEEEEDDWDEEGDSE